MIGTFLLSADPKWPRGLRRGSAAARFSGIVCSNAAGGSEVCLVSVVCCQVEVSAPSSSLVQRSPTEFDVSECDREASTIWRPWPNRSCPAIKKNLTLLPFTPPCSHFLYYSFSAFITRRLLVILIS